MLEYKGYVGEVVYDDEAEVLHARVINSGPYPNSQCRSHRRGGHQAGVPRLHRRIPQRVRRTRNRARRFAHDAGGERLIAPQRTPHLCRKEWTDKWLRLGGGQIVRELNQMIH